MIKNIVRDGKHSLNDTSYEEGYIYTGEFIENIDPLSHADNDEKKGEEKVAEETKKTGEAEKVEKTEKAEETKNSDKTVAEVFDTLTEEQKTVTIKLHFLSPWDCANVHAWTTEGDLTAWPGKAMEAESDGWYVATLSATTAINLLFNNNMTINFEMS